MTRLIAIAIWLTLSGNVAFARCQGAIVLAGFHDAYRAVIYEKGTQRKQAALTLLFTLGGQDVPRLAEQVERAGLNVSVERMQAAVENALRVAEIVAVGGLPESRNIHAPHIEWVAELSRQSGCANSDVTATTAPRLAPASASSKVQRASSSGSIAAFVEKLPKGQFYIVVGVITLAVAALGYGTYRLWTSVYMRRKRLERLPRSPISLTFQLTFTDPDGQMQQTAVTALDVSSGGLKLSWDNPPPDGTLMTLELPVGSRLGRVAWSNQYYAGVMLDEALSTTELKDLRNTARD